MMKNTDERIFPKEMKPTNGMLLEHIARYQFALPYINGRILDFACGSGYGSNMLAKALKFSPTPDGEVVGVDIDEATIQYAKQNYHHPKLKFTQGDVTDLTLVEKLGRFDCIVSFETLEHLHDEQVFLQNVYKLLKPSGTLVMSTPFGQGRGKPTFEPFHVHQLTRDEFFELFYQFGETEFFYQKGLVFEPAPGRNNVHYPIGIAVCKK